MKIRYSLFVLLSVLLLLPTLGEAENIFRERVYLHTDKQTYLSGELLWMKFYLTDETGKPSSLSKVGYVELVDESTAQVQEKLDINAGVAEGWMELPVTLPTGNYRLIAYTRNMRNEGEDVFFNKTIGIINTFKADASVVTDTVMDDIGLPSPVKGSVRVSTKEQLYSTQTAGEILIADLPENVHSLSVSIAGVDLVRYNEDISLWSDNLKKYADVPAKTDFLPEYEGHIISGKIIDISTNPASTEENILSLLGFVGDQVRLFGGTVKEGGNVSFFTKRITGSREMAVSTSSSFGNKYRINIESPFTSHREMNMPEFVINRQWQEQLLQRSIGMQVMYAYTADSMSRVDTTYSYFRHKPDRSFILEEYTRFNTMEEVVVEFIPPLRFRQYNNKRFLSVLMNENNKFSSNSMVLLDGIPIMENDIIFNYNPLLVYKIDVYKDKFVFGNNHFEGMVFLTTYQHDYPGLVLDESTQIFDYEGTQVRRYFYSPSYTVKNNVKTKTPDFRHTLLWMPNLETEGKSALSVPFSTSSLTGAFRVTVEGITKDGKIINGMSFFDVKN